MSQLEYKGPCLVMDSNVSFVSPVQDNIMSKQTEYWITMIVCAGLIPLLAFLGIPGNVFSAIVFCRQGLRERINLCLFAHALVDLAVLVTISLNSSENAYKKVAGQSWAIRPYVIGLTGTVTASRFLSAVIASERCFCVVSPFHAKRLLKTSTMAAIIVVCCVAFTAGMAAIAGPKLTSVCWFYPTTNATEEILIPTPYYRQNRFILDIVDIFAYATVFPGIFLAVIIVATSITVVKLRSAHAWRQMSVPRTTTTTPAKPKTPTAATTALERMAGEQFDARISSKEVSVTVMLVASSAVFIVCVTPNFLLQITTFLVPDVSNSGRYYNLASALWKVMSLLGAVNSSMHFFVYYKMGSKFRDSLKNMFK